MTLGFDRDVAKRLLDIYWMDYGQDRDVPRGYEEQTERDRKKIDALIDRTAEDGPGSNPEKWRSLGKGLYELKPTPQIRIPYFFHPTAPRSVVMTHLFVKKSRREQDELELARRRKEEGEDMPLP